MFGGRSAREILQGPQDTEMQSEQRLERQPSGEAINDVVRAHILELQGQLQELGDALGNLEVMCNVQQTVNRIVSEMAVLTMNQARPVQPRPQPKPVLQASDSMLEPLPANFTARMDRIVVEEHIRKRVAGWYSDEEDCDEITLQRMS